MALRLFGETAALRDFDPAYARFGSKADISTCPRDVRFTPSNVLVKRLASEGVIKVEESAAGR